MEVTVWREKTFTEIIYSVWLPAAIRYGIPYDTFWNLNPKILGIYQDIYIKRLEEQRDLINYTAWIQGQYNMASIGAAMNKKCKYPKAPFDFKGKNSGLSGEEKFLLWVDEFNRRFENQNQERVP